MHAGLFEVAGCIPVGSPVAAADRKDMAAH